MKKILMILTMALAATSCMDILDVAPEDQIASENMWTTEELADKGMAGLYFPFYATQLSSTQLRRADGLNRQGIEAMSFATDYYSNNYPVELLSLATKPAKLEIGMTFRCGMNGSSVTPSSMRVTMRLPICIKRIWALINWRVTNAKPASFVPGRTIV